MIRRSLILLFVLSSHILYSQDRVNKSLPKISKTIQKQLTTATGWILNPEGQWVSRKNRIPYFLENKSKILMDYEAYGLGMDNFIFFQLRDVKISDSTYYVLIKKYKDGYYRYRSIQKGWNNTISYYYYVFSKDEFHKLDSLKDGEINLISINLLTHGSLDLANDAIFLTDLEKEITKSIDEETYTETQLIFHIAPYKKKNIIQFQIYGWQTKYENTTGITLEHQPPKKGGDGIFDTDKIYLTADLFKYCYYESEYKTFNNFIGLK